MSISAGTIATVKQYAGGGVIACAKIYDYGRIVGYLIRPEVRPSFEDNYSDEDKFQFFSALDCLPEYDQNIHGNPLYGFDISSGGKRVFRVIDGADRDKYESHLVFLGNCFEKWAKRTEG